MGQTTDTILEIYRIRSRKYVVRTHTETYAGGMPFYYFTTCDLHTSKGKFNRHICCKTAAAAQERKADWIRANHAVFVETVAEPEPEQLPAPDPAVLPGGDIVPDPAPDPIVELTFNLPRSILTALDRESIRTGKDTNTFVVSLLRQRLASLLGQ